MKETRIYVGLNDAVTMEQNRPRYAVFLLADLSTGSEAPGP